MRRTMRGVLAELVAASDETDGEFGGSRLDRLRDARQAALAVLAPPKRTRRAPVELECECDDDVFVRDDGKCGRCAGVRPSPARRAGGKR